MYFDSRFYDKLKIIYCYMLACKMCDNVEDVFWNRNWNEWMGRIRHLGSAKYGTWGHYVVKSKFIKCYKLCVDEIKVWKKKLCNFIFEYLVNNPILGHI
jgi:hypothetical protein